MRRFVVPALLTLAACAEACSSRIPGAVQSRIAASQEFANISAGIVAIVWAITMALTLAKVRNWKYAAVMTVLLAAHPAWTSNPRGGDCGSTQTNMAVVSIALSALLWIAAAIGWPWRTMLTKPV